MAIYKLLFYNPSCLCASMVSQPLCGAFLCLLLLSSLPLFSYTHCLSPTYKRLMYYRADAVGRGTPSAFGLVPPVLPGGITSYLPRYRGDILTFSLASSRHSADGRDAVRAVPMPHISTLRGDERLVLH